MYRLMTSPLVIRRNGSRQRGVALLMVISTLVLVTSVVADFQYNSRVDLQLAMNSRDKLQAEYNALSVLRLFSLVIKQSRQLQDALGGLMKTLGVDPQAMPSISQMIQMVPMECGLLSTIAKPRKESSLSVDEEKEKSSEPDFFPGECLATTTSEHAKISINLLAQRTNGVDRRIAELLGGLLSDPKLERHFQEDDKNGTHAENPLQLVGAIADWVDNNKVESTNEVTDEDRHYTGLKDSYHTKNAPFDSIDELQLVHGVDDELFALLKDHVTIYSDTTAIEIATATPLQIGAGLLASKRAGVSVVDMIPGLLTLVKGMNELRGKSMGMFTLTMTILLTLVEQAALTPYVDVNRLRQVFTDHASNTWYTLVSEGRVGNASVTLRAVFQAREGKFYYFRME